MDETDLTRPPLVVDSIGSFAFNPPPPPRPPRPTLPSTGRTSPVVAAVIVAAVVGAIVSGVAVKALDDDTTSSSSSPGISSGVRDSDSSGKPQSIRGILQRVEPAVVALHTQNFSSNGLFGEGAGTGMILTPDGEVLTNAHVVNGATSIKVTLFGETTEREADLVGSDPAADVALVKIRGASGLPTVVIGSSADLQVGDDVIAIGNALGLAGGPTVTAGIVSAKERSLDENLSGLIQTDAAINPGNSGGPLVNASAEVVGMNTAVIQRTGQEAAQNIGFAIAADRFKPIVARIRSGDAKVSSTTFLGVSTVTMTPAIRQRFGFVPEQGAIIDELVPGSPAANAGLRRADVIVGFGETEITTADELVNAVRQHKPGERVNVVAFRGSSERTFTVVLGSRASANP